MVNGTFVEVAGIKPRGGHAAILGRLAGGGFTRLALAAAMAAALFPFAARAQDAGRKSLHGHVPPALARFHLQPMSRLPATNRLHLAIGLPLRNQAALDKLLSEIYSPASTNYHRYLAPEPFTERFGPTEQDYQTVIAFAKRNGLTVTATHANRVLLDVSGAVPDIERAFGVTLRTYRHPTENRTFHAPDVEPSVESGVPILDVSGLDDYALPHPQSLRVMPMANPTNAVPNAGSGPGGTYRGNDFRAAYLPGVTLDGTGQTVGLLEFDGYYPNDIAAYTSASGLTNVPLQNVLLDGFSGAAGSDNIEVALDIEVAIAMAPALTKIVVFEAPNNTAYFNDILNAMAASNSIKQFGCSWSYSGTPNATMDQIFQQMGAQGQSFFDAAGDSDAYTGSTGVPNDNPNITIVGGTTLSTTGPGGSWVSETVWNSGGGVGSGGGISTYYSIPSWQTNIIMTTNQGSTTMRNIPDVALIADQVWVVHDNGVSSGYVTGTSIASPLWAALVALANQLAASNGRPSVGFINPAIYAIGESANYSSDFHDIHTGNNFWSSSPANFPAVPGFDLCTGWGTPAGQSLINNLVSPDTLGIVPGVGFAASGPAGGPFSPSSQNFFLTNSSASPLTWSLVNTSAWLNASTTSGTLAVGATNSVTVSLTAAANSLAVGTYAAIVTLTNWDTHNVQNLPFTLQALQPLVVTPAAGFTGSGPVGGPFSVMSQNFLLTNSGTISLNWSLINTSAWLTASGGGTLAAGATTMAPVSLSFTATNLATGIYIANVWFTNQTSGGARSLQFKLLVNQPLVQNGGFETGDFTGWTQSGNTGYTTVSSGSSQFAHSGTYGVRMGPVGSLGYLSQTIPTMAGQNYLLSLWLDSPNTSGTLTPNEFSVLWNGGKVFDQLNIGKIGWTNLQFIVTATASSAVLQLGFRDDPYYLGLDDVSVTPVPVTAFQPAILMQTNNAFNFTWNAITGLVYQVQFKTNLLQTNWSVLANIAATNTAMTFVDTNPITGSPQKFYRLLLQ
jgi:hypothetical protein